MSPRYSPAPLGLESKMNCDSARSVRKILARYTSGRRRHGVDQSHKLWQFLLTWLKTQGIDDALIPAVPGYETRQPTLKIYSCLALQMPRRSTRGSSSGSRSEGGGW